MAEFRGEIIGIEETLAKVRLVTKVLTSRDAQSVTMFAARAIQREARRRAPQAKVGFSRLNSKISTKPGQLKRSIVARGVSLEEVDRRGPAAFVLPLIWRGSAAARAPHAHLVAFGTQDRRPAPGKVFAFPGSDGRLVYTRRAKGLTANPYMEEAIDTAGPEALFALSEALDELLARRLS